MLIIEVTVLGAGGYTAMMVAWYHFIRPATLNWVRQRRTDRDR